MAKKEVICRMVVGQQQRGPTFREHVDPDDLQACRELAGQLVADRHLPGGAALQIKVRGRWVTHRPA